MQTEIKLIKNGIFSVFVLEEDKKHPGYFKTGRKIFTGTEFECIEFQRKAR
jgi:hypothetical protein